MSVEKVKSYFKQFNMEERVLELNESSVTVELAAAALHCEPARIAKTLSFHVGEKVILVVTAGTSKIDNRKYREQFGIKAKMLAFEEVEPLVGHGVGSVCPFGINESVEVYLDDSLKKFETVFPAAGSGNSAIELSIAELETYSRYVAWVDVCKN